MGTVTRSAAAPVRFLPPAELLEAVGPVAEARAKLDEIVAGRAAAMGRKTALEAQRKAAERADQQARADAIRGRGEPAASELPKIDAAIAEAVREVGAHDRALEDQTAEFGALVAQHGAALRAAAETDREAARGRALELVEDLRAVVDAWSRSRSLMDWLGRGPGAPFRSGQPTTNLAGPNGDPYHVNRLFDGLRAMLEGV
jgi:hypothetical protein